MRYLCSAMIVVLLLAACSDNSSDGFDFAELEQLEQAEQQELLAQAKRAAKAKRFVAAQALLHEAQQKGYAPNKVAAVQQQINDSREAYAQEQERERQAAAQRLAQQRANTRSSSGAGVSARAYVQVDFESVCGLSQCLDNNLQLSGGPGNFSAGYSGATSGGLHKGYNGLAGTYRWSAQVDNTVCSGSIYVSGSKNVAIRVYKNCSDAGSFEY